MNKKRFERLIKNLNVPEDDDVSIRSKSRNKLLQVRQSMTSPETLVKIDELLAQHERLKSMSARELNKIVMELVFVK
jgi:predicted N-formylglutamate amidohydrolase